MKVCVIGLGYIGLPTSCIIAKAGHEVVGVDVNDSLVQKLSEGHLHIVNEDGLQDLWEAARQTGKIRFALSPESADVFIIAVPTPFAESPIAHSNSSFTPEPDLSYVRDATMAIVPYVRSGNLVILESTVPPRTTEDVVLPTLERAGVDVTGVLFAHAPERVLPGNLVYELSNNARIVGGLTEEAGQVARDFYRSFVSGQVIVTDASTAELVKLMENTYRDVNIALANELARVCEHIGVNVWEAISLANLHPRVNILRPGPGVGGHCIAVDPYFIVDVARNLTPVIQAARHVNRIMPHHVVQRVLNGLPKGAKIAALGASYKANVGDLRESPALEVVELIRSHGCEVAVHDPYIGGLDCSIEEVLAGADLIVLLTDHELYRGIDPLMAARLVNRKVVLDTRHHLDTITWSKAGFTIHHIGVATPILPD